MPQLKSRLARIEATQPPRGYEPITEIHRVIVGPDGKTPLDKEGMPWVIVRRIAMYDGR
jgi:hypothetical protein